MWELMCSLNLRPLKRRVGKVVIFTVVLAGCVNTAIAILPKPASAQAHDGTVEVRSPAQRR